MRYLELALIKYRSGSKEICEAPMAALQVGDIVKTEFDYGVVEDLYPVCEDNRLFQLMQKERKIYRVLSIMKELKYDLPTERND